MSEYLLEVENLSVRRGDRWVVEGVSFTLLPRMNMAVIGPNGAGKSSLIQAILGIIPYQRGRVTLLGHGMAYRRPLPYVRQQVAYLPQNFQCDPRIPITVAEFVGLGWGKPTGQWPWQYRKQRDRAIFESLQRLHLEHLAAQPMSSLSGGEIKRALLAYCLVRPRRLLILDEAPAGLDLHSEQQFYDLLENLKASEGWAVLQISHHLERVRATCDQVLYLNRSVQGLGTPERVLQQFAA
ncbi:MAG: metal ABC transporter ATP-binding protein [Thermosynechococcus sp. Uc]|uniref:metal ABC transporter ATP-binding protein n=1 Tax=Thermosynechococcus sp. Uc TaxID=3034853 RepID=UPI00259EE092|nr:metal ABC transporter ATP-binding protein [Thermosynechococcus sp. Uc]MDM7327347.1 metal ABC transporter ATP-binding protein [Thermosynechococcus sp. Uc]